MTNFRAEDMPGHVSKTVDAPVVEVEKKEKKAPAEVAPKVAEVVEPVVKS
jgi:hypothetical protein